MNDSPIISSAQVALERLKAMNLQDKIAAEAGVPGFDSAGLRALDIQEGGNHYKDMAIQPVEYITANKIEFMEGSVIKYVSRHANKNGAQDIKKAIHFLNLILDLRYPEIK